MENDGQLHPYAYLYVCVYIFLLIHSHICIHMCIYFPKNVLDWLIFVHLIQTRDTWEEGLATEEVPPLDWPGDMCERHFLSC